MQFLNPVRKITQSKGSLMGTTRLSELHFMCSLNHSNLLRNTFISQIRHRRNELLFYCKFGIINVFEFFFPKTTFNLSCWCMKIFNEII
jgi:hypothetical protein